MQKPSKTSRGPVVVTIRMRARLVAFVAVLAVFAVVLVLGASPNPSRDHALLLSANRGSPAETTVDALTSRAAVQSPPASLDTAPMDLVAVAALAAAAATAQGGGGLVQSPSLAMEMLNLDALAAPAGVPNGFIRPVPGPESSGFGPRIHPLLGRAMFHTGIDLMSPCSTPVRAAAAGTVEYAAVSESWGRRIIIAHSPTLKTAYGHMSRFIAHEGDVVKQGEVIGLVGTTGWSTGCHLHWDVIRNGRYVDPAPYLGLPASTAVTIPFLGSGPSSPRAQLPRPTQSLSPRVSAVPDGDVPIPRPTATKPTRHRTPPTPTASTPKSSAGTTSPGTKTRAPATRTSGASSTTGTPTPPSSTTKPAASTTKPPASSTTKPPASSTTKPPASSTTKPPASSTTKPPASSTTTPPTSTPPTSTSPADTSTSTPPADTSTSTPPADTSTSTPPSCPATEAKPGKPAKAVDSEPGKAAATDGKPGSDGAPLDCLAAPDPPESAPEAAATSQ